MKQQTAVEWLIQKLSEPTLLLSWYRDELYEQAKEMEKQQILDALNRYSDETIYNDLLEQYYNETYGSKGSDAQRIYGEHTIQILEISDEIIEKEANRMHGVASIGFEECAKWYREQLRKISANQ